MKRSQQRTMKKKVLVSGCFDLLHSGHIAFLEEASTYGDLYVSLGSDENVRFLKGRFPVCTESERQYMVKALRCVTECRVSKGRGILDFQEELDEIKPDILVVNEDGNTPAKADLCRRLGIEYLVLKRLPHGNLPPRSTTTLRTECTIPYRIDLAGGWLDQPFVSRFAPGPVLTISIEPTVEFNDRSGMATSTRKKAVQLWKTAIPHGDREQLARVLFGYDNLPGTTTVSGSQDALGIVLPGLNRLYYDGNYWPASIESVHDEGVLHWIERHVRLITLGPREQTFDVLQDTHITAEDASALASAAAMCWKAILDGNLRAFGEHLRKAFDTQTIMFPRMLDSSILATIDQYRDRARGWKLSGAGGGGYLILVTEEDIPGSMTITIRRPGLD
jgi:cytidyltransferase-like protein